MGVYLIIKYDFIMKTNFDIVHSMQLIYKMRVLYICTLTRCVCTYLNFNIKKHNEDYLMPFYTFSKSLHCCFVCIEITPVTNFTIKQDMQCTCQCSIESRSGNNFFFAVEKQ